VVNALAAGYRRLDTAAVYNNHGAVGKALRVSGVARDDVFITSKVSWIDCVNENTSFAAVEEIIADLGVLHVDLVLLHFPAPPATPSVTSVEVWQSRGLRVDADAARGRKRRAAAWRGLERALAQGLTRAIGVSNYEVPHLREMASYARIPPAANQVEVHPYLPRIDLVAWCERRGVQIEAYASVVPDGSRALLDNPAVAAIAKRVGATPAQVLLRWAQRRGLVVLPRTTDPVHLLENRNAVIGNAARLGVRDAADLDALSCEGSGSACGAPASTGCGPFCPRGQFLWSAAHVTAETVADATVDAFLPVRSAPSPPPAEAGAPPPPASEEPAVPGETVPPLSMGATGTDETLAGGLAAAAERVVPRRGGVAATDLLALPVRFDPGALRREALAVCAGWAWNSSEHGHARPLLSAGELPEEFRNHFINTPHAAAGLLARRAPTLRKIYDFFRSRTEVVAFRILRRLPLTAYGLHNDEDLHVRPNIRRFQIPLVATPKDARLLVLPFASQLSLVAARGSDYAATNPLTGYPAYPSGRRDHDRGDGTPWFDDPGARGYAAERAVLEAQVRDFEVIGSSYELDPGTPYFFDTMRLHTLVNLGREPRLTLVVDVTENMWLAETLPLVASVAARNRAGDAAELVRAARAVRDAALSKHERCLSLKVADPPDGRVDVAASRLKFSVRIELSWPDIWHREAFGVLCGRLVVGTGTQRADKSCALVFSLKGQDIRVEEEALRSFEVDTSVCIVGAPCKLKVHLIDGDGVNLSPAKAITVHVFDDGDSDALISRLEAVTFSDLRWAGSHGAAAGGFLGTGALYYTLAYAQRARTAVVLGSGGERQRPTRASFFRQETSFARSIAQAASRQASSGVGSATLLWAPRHAPCWWTLVVATASGARPTTSPMGHGSGTPSQRSKSGLSARMPPRSAGLPRAPRPSTY